MQRDLILISHANPTDNDAARWYGAKLRALGYRVFLDLFEFKGGNRFWPEIENAIRNRAVKVLVLLSRTSNAADGVLKEIAVAATTGKMHPELGDFIVPVLIDDLPYGDTNIQLAGLDIIDGRHWDAGLRDFVEKLETDNAPKTDVPSADALIELFLDTEMRGTVEHRPEWLEINWLLVSDVPTTLYQHLLGSMTALPAWIPVVRQGAEWFTFASREELQAAGIQPIRSRTLAVGPLSEQPRDRFDRDHRNRVVELLRVAFEMHCARLGLLPYDLSHGRSYFFPSGLIDGDKIAVQFPGRTRRSHIAVAGRARKPNIRGEQPYWHLAGSARVIVRPVVALELRAHLHFSDDGRSVWDRLKRLNSFRRRKTRLWWNKQWRAKHAALMTFLAGGRLGACRIPLSPGTGFTVDFSPVRLEAPVSFVSPTEVRLATPSRRSS